jgi:hypothetical protein
MGTISANTWATVRLALGADPTSSAPDVIGQLNGNAAVVSGAAAAALVDGGYTFGVYLETLDSTPAERTFDLDQIFASSAHLEADMSF